MEATGFIALEGKKQETAKPQQASQLAKRYWRYDLISGRERQRDTERHRKTDTHRHRDRYTHTETDIHTDR